MKPRPIRLTIHFLTGSTSSWEERTAPYIACERRERRWTRAPELVTCRDCRKLLRLSAKEKSP